MDSIIQQMLEVSFHEYGESILNQERFPTQKLLNGIRRFLNSDYPDWEGTYEEENKILGEITGDYEMLRRGIYNFVKNAVRYGKKNGLIRVGHGRTRNGCIFLCLTREILFLRRNWRKYGTCFIRSIPHAPGSRGVLALACPLPSSSSFPRRDVEVKNVPNGVEFGLYIKKCGSERI